MVIRNFFDNIEQLKKELEMLLALFSFAELANYFFSSVFIEKCLCDNGNS